VLLQDSRLDDPLWDNSYTSSSSSKSVPARDSQPESSSSSSSLPPPPLPSPTIAQDDSAESLRLENACALADVLIVAAGSPGLVQGHWVKPGAVVVDVGFNVLSAEEARTRGLLSPPQGDNAYRGNHRSSNDTGSNTDSSTDSIIGSNSSRGSSPTSNTSGDFVCGDVRFGAARRRAAAITPVPGGVGPMTVAMLMRNTVQTFLRRQREQTPWKGL